MGTSFTISGLMNFLRPPNGVQPQATISTSAHHKANEGGKTPFGTTRARITRRTPPGWRICTWVPHGTNEEGIYQRVTLGPNPD